MSTPGNTKGDSSTVASTEDNKRKLSQDEVDQDESGDKKKGVNKRKKTKVDITLCILDKNQLFMSHCVEHVISITSYNDTYRYIFAQLDYQDIVLGD